MLSYFKKGTQMKSLEILKISCCGANEFNDINEILAFLKLNPRAEIGFGVSSQNSSQGEVRYNYISHLFQMLSENSIKNQVALHINREWSKTVAIDGKLPESILNLIKLAPGNIRLQVNYVGSGYGTLAKNPKKFYKLIESSGEKIRYILPFNSVNENFIMALSKGTNKFDVLYDNSFGTGKSAENYKFLFKNQLQGYAGGLSPDNIKKELNKINAVQKERSEIWIDAESGLRKDNLNTLDLKKAQSFLNNIYAWEKTINHQKGCEK